MVYLFNLTGHAQGWGPIYHGRNAIHVWLRSLGATERPHDSLLQLPDTVQSSADVKAFVDAGLDTPLGADVQLHLHTSMLSGRIISGQYISVYFGDMLRPEEWSECERRFALAQIAHTHELPREMATTIERYLD